MCDEPDQVSHSQTRESFPSSCCTAFCVQLRAYVKKLHYDACMGCPILLILLTTVSIASGSKRAFCNMTDLPQCRELVDALSVEHAKALFRMMTDPSKVGELCRALKHRIRADADATIARHLRTQELGFCRPWPDRFYSSCRFYRLFFFLLFFASLLFSSVSSSLFPAASFPLLLVFSSFFSSSPFPSFLPSPVFPAASSSSSALSPSSLPSASSSPAFSSSFLSSCLFSFFVCSPFSLSSCCVSPSFAVFPVFVSVFFCFSRCCCLVIWNNASCCTD